MPGVTKPRLAGFMMSMTSAARQRTARQPMPQRQRRVFRRDDPLVRGERGRARFLGLQTICRGRGAADDQGHPRQHAVVHRHAGHHEVHVARHQEHRQVKQNSRYDEETSDPERSTAAAV